MKPPLRTKSVGTKVSEAEFALLEERARGAGMRLGEWVREALLSAPAESGPDSGEVALGEVMELQGRSAMSRSWARQWPPAFRHDDFLGRNRDGGETGTGRSPLTSFGEVSSHSQR